MPLRFLPRLVPVLMLGCVLSAGPALFAGNPFTLFSTPSGDVFIVTDLTPAGKDFVPPTKEEPVHCYAINFGCSFGALQGEKLPDPTEFGSFVGKLLAEQGYLGSDEKHPPKLLITIQWGVLRGKEGYNMTFLGADKVGLVADEGSLSDYEGKIVPDSARSAAAQKIYDLAGDDLYVATVCGFDYVAYTAGKAEMLWKTRIACSSVGQSLAKALPDMVTLAAPAIGRETTQVIVTNPADKREGQVKLGELEVIEEDADKPTTPEAK
ncbi:MAG: hypothetical protein IAE82_11615 [Opitutaceae bacterium]|nr:hypothetical protein [Opitutaceae bacterium]